MVAVLLAAVLALLSPGTQAWAALAKTGAAPSAGQTLPAGKMAVAPVIGSGGSAFTPTTLNLAPGVAAPGAAPVRQREAGAAVSVEASVPIGMPVVPGLLATPDLHPAEPTPSAGAVVLPAAPASQEVSGREAVSPSAEARLGSLASEAAPYLEAAAAKDASPSSLRENAALLQRVIEGGLERPTAASADALFAAPLAAPSGTGLAAPSDLESAEGSGDAGTQAPLPTPELSKEAKTKFRFYSGAVAGVKVGIEALNLAVPLLLLTQFQAATAVATLYLAAEVASIFAGLVGGALVDLVGPKQALTLTGFAQALAIAGVPLAIASGGALALPLVYGLFMVNGVASELFDVARRAVLPQIVGQDEGLLRKYNGGVYVWREIAATVGVFGAGWYAHEVGAMSTIWLHPAFCVAAALAALRLLRSGMRAHPARASPAQGAGRAPRGVKTKFKAWYDDLKQGLRYVVSEKKLRTIVLVNIPLTALHKIFHTLMAVVYAAKVLDDPAMAAVLLGAWNLGELAGAFYLNRWGRQSRLSNWMRLAAAASLAVWSFYLLPSALAGVLVSFVLAAAMIGNELGTASYIQASVPEKELGAVTGFVYGFARAVGMIGLILSGWAFDVLGPSGGFMAMGVIFTLLAPIYLLASLRFKSDKLGSGSGPPQN